MPITTSFEIGPPGGPTLVMVTRHVRDLHQHDDHCWLRAGNHDAEIVAVRDNVMTLRRGLDLMDVDLTGYDFAAYCDRAAAGLETEPRHGSCMYAICCMETKC